MPPRPIGSTIRYLPIVSGSRRAGPPPPMLTRPPGSGEPVAERLHGRSGLDQALADHGDDLFRGGSVAVDADGLHLYVDDFAGDRLDLALHDHAHGLVGGLRRIGHQRVLAELARHELAVVGVDAVGEA